MKHLNLIAVQHNENLWENKLNFQRVFSVMMNYKNNNFVVKFDLSLK